MEGSAVNGHFITETITLNDNELEIHIGCIIRETKLIYGQVIKKMFHVCFFLSKKK